MSIKSFAAAACLSLVTATSSFAATFTIGGDNFDITTITGTFGDNQALLEGQVWFGNEDLALDFASVFGTSAGFPNFGENTPLFAYVVDVNLGFEVSAATIDILRSPVAELRSTMLDEIITYAVATPISAVPLPAGGLLLLSGLAGVVGLKRRKKRTA